MRRYSLALDSIDMATPLLGKGRLPMYVYTRVRSHIDVYKILKCPVASVAHSSRDFGALAVDWTVVQAVLVYGLGQSNAPDYQRRMDQQQRQTCWSYFDSKP